MSELPSLSNTIHHTKALIFEEVEVTVRDVDLRIAKELMSRKPETEYKVIDKRPGPDTCSFQLNPRFEFDQSINQFSNFWVHFSPYNSWRSRTQCRPQGTPKF